MSASWIAVTNGLVGEVWALCRGRSRVLADLVARDDMKSDLTTRTIATGRAWSLRLETDFFVIK
jgi:hypothetical protein